MCVCVCTLMQLQSVQYASDLQNLLNIPLRPASSAQRLFPVAEEQHDSLPVLCVKKHQVCQPFSPSSSILYTGYKADKQLAIDTFCHTLVISSLTLNTFNISQIKLSLLALSNTTVSASEHEH